MHMVQTAGLALASDPVDEEDQPKVVGLIYVTLLVGMVISALVYGALLEAYTPGRLIQVIQGTAVLTVALNLFAMWKQEARSRARAAEMEAAPPPVPFAEAMSALMDQPNMLRLLVVIALGTFGFGMADVLLEPYGGQALGFSVAETTKLTALLAAGTLVGFGIASRALSAGGQPENMAVVGAAVGIPGFTAIILSSLGGGSWMFLAGTLLTGLGAGLFGHATLTSAIRRAPKDRIGLALGAWGAVQATAAGIGVALAGVVRDVILSTQGAGSAVHTPYNVVFLIEIAFLALAVLVAIPLAVRRKKSRAAGAASSQTHQVEVS